MQGLHYDEEVLLVHSYKNSVKSESNLIFIPRKPSIRKKFGIRWKDNNEIYHFEKDEPH